MTRRTLTVLALFLSLGLLQGCPEIEGLYACSQTCGGIETDWARVCSDSQGRAQMLCISDGESLCGGLGRECPYGCSCYARLLEEGNCSGLCNTAYRNDVFPDLLAQAAIEACVAASSSQLRWSSLANSKAGTY